jgi:hypothetical protein
VTTHKPTNSRQLFLAIFLARVEDSMLSFELANEGRAIEISLDEQGIVALIKALERVRADGDHIHLCTPSNGGRDLSEKSPWGKEAIGEVIINWVGE